MQVRSPLHLYPHKSTPICVRKHTHINWATTDLDSKLNDRNDAAKQRPSRPLNHRPVPLTTQRNAMRCDHRLDSFHLRPPRHEKAAGSKNQAAMERMMGIRDPRPKYRIRPGRHACVPLPPGPISLREQELGGGGAGRAGQDRQRTHGWLPEPRQKKKKKHTGVTSSAAHPPARSRRACEAWGP
jgi:hypothetical protein